MSGLAGQDYPHDRFEVIVVDDGSAAPPRELIDEFAATLEVRLIVQDRQGPAAARNLGAQHARGQHLAFTDDDCVPEPGWLSALADACRDDRTALGGLTVNDLRDDAYATASQLLIDYLYAYYNTDADGARFFTSNNFLVPTDRFREAGGFASEFGLPAGEDREFCDRWAHEGGRLRFVANAIVHHYHHLTLRRFIRQHFRYGRGALPYRRARAARGNRVSIEPVAFYLGLLAFPVRRLDGWAALQTAVLIVVSQLANAAGLAWEIVFPHRSAATEQPVRKQIKPMGTDWTRKGQ